MPTTVNGIGTTYVGRKNEVQYLGVCDSCNRESVLEDYETGYFICVIFIPLIPLGRKQIIGYCHNCTRHRSMSVRQWEQTKEAAIQTGMDKLTESPDDPLVAIELVHVFTTFHEFAQAKELAAATQSQYQDDVPIQLAIGAWYDRNQLPELSSECFQRAYELDPDHPVAIRATAVEFLEQGAPHKALERLQPLLPPSEQFDPQLFFVLANSFIELGDGAKGLELYELIEANSKQFAANRQFKKAAKKLRKQLAT